MILRNAAIAHALLIGLTVGMVSVSASAQATGSIYIPFAFTANHQNVPAGFYKVDLLSDRYLSRDRKLANAAVSFFTSPARAIT